MRIKLLIKFKDMEKQCDEVLHMAYLRVLGEKNWLAQLLQNYLLASILIIEIDPTRHLQ